MHRTTLHRLVPALLALALGPACGDDGGGTTTDGAGSCVAALKPGQLVITEIMPDPAHADADGIEWFELYNPTSDELSLSEIGLELSKVDGTDAKGHRIPEGDLTIAPGAYMTFGRITEDLRPDYIDYAYGADLSMGNTDGKVRIVCGDAVIDEALYEDLSDGVARQLDARIAPPDPEANDDLGNWCDATEALGEEFATPRAANTTCPLEQPACGQCYEGETLRDVMAPRPGQLVVNEIMANASSAPESPGEWFEVFVADGPVDLNCLQYGGNTTKFAADPADAEVLEAPTCLTVEAGDYVVFGDAETWQTADFEIGFTLVDNDTTSNPDPGIYLAYADQILDEVHYNGAKDGIASSLDPDFADPADNDDPNAFCAAVDVFIAAELGTPGAENPQCPETCAAGTCIDGDSCRPVNLLGPGDLLITEVFPDPGAMSPDGEWFEFIVAKDGDLNGLTFGKTLETPYATVPNDACLPVAAGAIVLVAATADPAQNGELPTPDIVHDKISLTNTDSSLVIGAVGPDGTATLLDMVTWGSTADGKSHQLAIESIPAAGPFDPAVNDAAEAWCDAQLPFGVGDLGTPQAENHSCTEPPDPDPMCDDGNGGRLVNFAQPGDLIITEIHPDPDALIKQNPDSGEPHGEWFEVYVAADVDLNGLELGNPGVKFTVPVGPTEPCVPAAKGSHVVFARRGDVVDPPVLAMDPLDNGGITMPAVQYDGLSLSNSGGTLAVGLAGVELDSAPFAKPMPGKAWQLDANADCTLADAPLDSTCNDDPMAWCPQLNANYGLGDFGTPALANSNCPQMLLPDECIDTQNGDVVRKKVAPQPGDLVITEFLANPAGLEPGNEWFEVFVANPVDLNDLKILGTGAPLQVDIDAAPLACNAQNCLSLAAGSYALFAHATNDLGLVADCDLKVTLSNSNDGLAIAHGGALLHGVAYAASQTSDVSVALDPASKDPMFTDADAPPWCASGSPGSPKQENPSCP